MIVHSLLHGALLVPGFLPRPLPVYLRWRACDPHAVWMVADGKPWVFGWQLLADGMRGIAGEGDVQIRPLRGGTHSIVLDNGRHRAAVQIPTPGLAQFVHDVAAVWADVEISPGVAAFLAEFEEVA